MGLELLPAYAYDWAELVSDVSISMQAKFSSNVYTLKRSSRLDIVYNSLTLEAERWSF